MKTLDLARARGSLAGYARRAGKEPVVLTSRGRPVAALVGLDNTDLETATLSTNARFLALIERSRARHGREGGIAAEQVRRRLAIAPAARRRAR